MTAIQADDKRQPLIKSVKNRPAFLSPDTTPRILLFFFAVTIQLIASTFSGIGWSLDGRGYWLAGMVLWLMWFFLMFLIVTPHTDTLLERHRGWLKRGAKIIFMTLFIVGIAEILIMGLFSFKYLDSGARNDFARLLEQMRHGFQYNDGTALSQQAAENLLDGKNPYAHANIVEALIKYDGSYDRATPLRVGRFANVFPYPTQEQLKQLWESALQNPSQPPPEIESHICYPAGTFLLPAPFIAAGLKDIRIIYAIFVIAGLVYAAWRIPGRRRILFIGVVLISLEIWNSIAIGETGSIIYPFLLVAWVTLGKNNWLSAICMGIAVTTKQTAWFFLPFYLILLWRMSKPKTVGATIGVIAALFLAANIYFIINNPALWLLSVTSPMIESMFPLGVGVVATVTSGFINVRTALPFTVLEVIVLISAIAWYIRNCARYPDAGLILAILPLFFAWRSLWTYFFYVTIIILTRMLIKGEHNPSEVPPLRFVPAENCLDTGD